MGKRTGDGASNKTFNRTLDEASGWTIGEVGVGCGSGTFTREDNTVD